VFRAVCSMLNKATGAHNITCCNKIGKGKIIDQIFPEFYIKNRQIFASQFCEQDGLFLGHEKVMPPEYNDSLVRVGPGNLASLGRERVIEGLPGMLLNGEGEGVRTPLF